MIRLFKSFAAKLWLSLVLLIVLSGILISAGRLFTPFISEFRTEIAGLASQTLGQPVELRELEARWKGWGPEMVLKGVSLADRKTGKSALQVSEIGVTINLLASLKAGAIVPQHVTLKGVRIAVRLEKDGRLSIRGLSHLGEGEADSSAIFLAPRSLSVRESEVIWENRAMAGPPIVFSGVRVDVRNDDTRHQLKGELQIADYEKGRIGLTMDITGDTSVSTGWSGEAYLKGESFPLARILSNRLPKRYNLLNGLGEFEFWGNLRSGTLTELSGTATGKDIIVERMTESDSSAESLLQIDRIGGSFQLLLSEQDWDFRGRSIQIEADGNRWPLGRVELITQRNETGVFRLQAGSDFLPIEQTDAIARFFLPAGHELQQALFSVAPEGDLYDLRILLEKEAEIWTWSMTGEVSELTTHPWQRVPGLDNLAFRFSANQSEGRITFDTTEGALYFEELFRDPLFLDRLHGDIDWKRSGDGGWSLTSGQIVASNNDIWTRSRVSLSIPSSPEESPFLDLQTDFFDGDASATSRYLPVGIMSDNVVQWLDRSIIEGRVTSGSCLIRGPLRDFPFSESQTGRFEVLFETRDVTLDYWPEWPAVWGVDAEVRFLNNRFDAWVSEGSILESRIRKTHARIDDLRRASPLKVNGNVKGTLNDGLKLLRDSTLREQFGVLTQSFTGEGEIELELGFVLPLRGGGKTQLNGQLSFLESKLILAERNLSVDAIEGSLNFDQNSLWSDEIRANLLGREIGIRLDTDGVAETTRLRAAGVFSSVELLNQIGETDLDRIRGESEWHLELDIPHRFARRSGTVQTRLYSDLRGVTIDLPRPFGKTSDEPRRLQVTTDFSTANATPVKARYGSLLAAYFLFQTGEEGAPVIKGVNLMLGGEMAQRPETATLRIDGKLDLLELTELAGLVIPSRQGNTLPPLQEIDLAIGTLRLNTFEVHNARINVDRADGAWSGLYRSDEAEGAFHIPLDTTQDRARIRFSRLNIESHGGETEREVVSPERALSELDPESLPLLDLNIDQLSVNGYILGTLSASTAKHPGGVELTSLVLDGGETNLKLYGTWRKRPDSHQETSIGFDLNSSSLGLLLSTLDIYQDLDKAPAEIEGRLKWSGSPLDFDYRRLDGTLALQVGEGHLLKLKPGLGRLLGLLNITEISRRLSLDFSDLTKKGLAFDSIEGNIWFDGEDAYTNDLVVEGPSSRIELSGRSGLLAEDLDYLVTVTPQLSSAIPIAGTIAGGPVVGAALLVAQQLLGEKVDAASRLQYLVKGPWSEPEVKRNKSILPEQP